ncbi:MAG TPA: DNA repair protein RadC [Chloroflexota bacterium]|jgi:DNA repair protein RadC|nr:DNA repair protein RadC [Chloroflexota bacterium]
MPGSHGRGRNDGAATAPPTLKDLDPSERPRERLFERGPAALSTAELLAILLRTGVPGTMVTDLARDLLREYNGLAGLARVSAQELALYHGVGPAKAAQLKAALELGRRLMLEESATRERIQSPEDLARLVRLDMSVLEQEQLRVFLLDTKNRVMSIRTLYTGTLNQSTVRVAEIFKAAIRENCAAIAIVHNHPSGDPTPSPEDIRVTRAIVEAGRLLDIDVLDHVIIGRGSPPYVSLRERGLGFRP